MSVLYQLLGGKSRDKVMVYKHVGGLDIGEVVEGVVAMREQGLDAIRAQVSIPGLPPIYGTGPSTDQAAGGMIKPMVTGTAEAGSTVTVLVERHSSPSSSPVMSTSMS